MKSKTAATLGYRNDINGLRAWAVVAVMLYHFGVPGFKGGFVGVDVFFVISGFLMTGIVVSGLERGTAGGAVFSVMEFYMARARRILPALIVLCASLLMLGWWVLPQLEYQMLGTHAALSLVFLSNFKFWRETGYFDPSSHEKWLLHTWSLAVEWQFYLLLPLLLIAVWKFRPSRRAISTVITVGVLASLAWSVMLTPLRPTEAFFLLPTRAWEMLAGALVYLLAHRIVLTARQRTVLEFAGFGMVIAAIGGFDASSNWPGWRALVPVIGAVIVLLAAQSRSLWTGNSVAQWLGTRSYSIYLWHWPIVVALAYMELDADALAISVGILLTLVLGHLSYRWVETLAGIQINKLQVGRGAIALVCMAALVAASGALVYLQKGVAGRFTPKIDLANNERINKKPRQDVCFTKTGTSSPSCMYGGSRLRAVLIGDSHADAVTTALAAAVPSGTGGIMDLTYISCLTAFGVKNLSASFGPEGKCGEYLEWMVKKLADIPKDIPLVIVNRTSVYAVGHNEPWRNTVNTPLVYFSQPYPAASPAFLAEFAQHVTETACQLAKNHPVYMVRPIPEMGIDVPKAIVHAMVLGRHKEISISLAEYHRRHDFVWAAQDAARDECGVKILDPLPYLCRDGRCQGVKDDRPLYYDDNHLSEFGNKLLVPMFAEIFSKR